MSRRKTNSFGDRLLMVLVGLFLYAPIIILIVFSFNAGNSSSVWKGFSLHWYAELLNDRLIMHSVYTTLLVSLLATVIPLQLSIMSRFDILTPVISGAHWRANCISTLFRSIPNAIRKIS